MKYIDTDSLRARINEMINEIVVNALDPDARIEKVASAKYKKDALSDVLSLIDSLQQEQPDVDFEKAIKEEMPPMTDDKELGLCICDHWGNHRVTVKDIYEIARHFIEVGKQLSGLIDLDEICSSAGIPAPYKDGNQWCILKGDNIQEGVVGFGDTKMDALVNFIKDITIQQEQREVDLEEEIRRTYRDGSVADTSDMDHVDYENMARHFYELGRNARKEE